MANRRLVEDYSSDEEVPQFTEEVRFGPQREWVASWTPELFRQLMANENDARTELMSLVVEFGDDPNPIFIGANQLAWFEWRAKVLWNGRQVDWIPLRDAYNIIAGNVPQFALWFLNGNNLPTNEDGVITLKYRSEIIHTEYYDSVPGMAVTDAADVAVGYLLSIFNGDTNQPTETISDD